MTLTREQPSPKELCHACEKPARFQVDATFLGFLSRLALCEAHRVELGEMLYGGTTTATHVD